MEGPQEALPGVYRRRLAQKVHLTGVPVIPVQDGVRYPRYLLKNTPYKRGFRVKREDFRGLMVVWQVEGVCRSD